MKKIILILLMILPISFALYGGETINYTFDKCEYLTAKIEANNLSYNEWDIEPNCTETSLGFWDCQCEDNWTLFLAPKPNAVGTYNLTLLNYYSEAESEVIHQKGTGRGHDWGKTLITISTTSTTSTTTTILSTSTSMTTTTITIPEEEETPDNSFGLIALAFLVILSILIIIVAKKKHMRRRLNENINNNYCGL